MRTPVAADDEVTRLSIGQVRSATFFYAARWLPLFIVPEEDRRRGDEEGGVDVGGLLGRQVFTGEEGDGLAGH